MDARERIGGTVGAGGAAGAAGGGFAGGGFAGAGFAGAGFAGATPEGGGGTAAGASGSPADAAGNNTAGIASGGGANGGGAGSTCVDVDGDGHAPLSATGCNIPADDCDDTDFDRHPGSIAVGGFSKVPTAGGSWDWDCSGAEEKEYTKHFECAFEGCYPPKDGPEYGLDMFGAPKCGSEVYLVKCIGYNQETGSCYGGNDPDPPPGPIQGCR